MATSAQKPAFLFPGQGSQHVGMGRELAETFRIAAETFQEADQLLGRRLSNLCWEGPSEALNDTLNTQPALLTHSIAIFRSLQHLQPDFQPRFTAGHSVGEFAALVISGSLQFKDALLLVQERARLMQEAGVRNPGGMAAILGLDLAAVERLCDENAMDYATAVWVANDNCPGQVVISGKEEGLEKIGPRLRQSGAKKIVRLAVSIAAHSPLMSHAQEHFNAILRETSIQDPHIPIFGNVQASILKSADAIREELSAQLTSRVRWTESIKALIEAGVTTFYECGPGDVLAGLTRRIDRSVPISSLESPLSIASIPSSQPSAK